jgi:glyoxylase I family protein
VPPPAHRARLHHLALRSADPERSARFYADVIGLREVRRAEEGGALRAVWMALDGAVLMIERALRAPEAPSSGTGHVLALGVDDLAAWEAHLVGQGVNVVDRTTFTLFVLDPDGHRVALSTYPLDDVLA